jgi:hypothetical protein
VFLESLCQKKTVISEVKSFRCFLKPTTEINPKYLQFSNLKKPRVYKVLIPGVNLVLGGGGERVWISETNTLVWVSVPPINLSFVNANCQPYV